MARPVNADADATRRRILDTALALFADSGLDGVSIRRIAADAGVSLAMVHHYFGSKDELHAACVDAMYARLVDLRGELDAALRGAAGLDDVIDRAVRAGYRFAREHRAAVRMLLRQVVSAGELDERRRRDTQGPFLDQVTRELGRLLGRPPGELRLPLQSVVMMTARYAASSDRELTLLAGVDEPVAAARAVEDHLVATARALFRRP